MKDGNPNDVPRATGLLMLALFLTIVAIGIATVVVPEIRTDPERMGRDAGA